MNVKLESIMKFCEKDLDRLIEHNIANTRRYKRDLSIIMFDLDHFKNVNDRFGHLAGDKVLKEVSRTVLSKIRKGHYGPFLGPSSNHRFYRW